MRLLATAGLAVMAITTAVVLGNRVRLWNEDLALGSPPIAAMPERIDDPGTPRLAGRVVLVIVDGLGADEAGLPFLDELRRRGVAATQHVAQPPFVFLVHLHEAREQIDRARIAMLFG